MTISDRLLQKAVMQVESGGDPNAVSPKGALGRMQVMPATAANPGFGIKPAGRNKDGSFKSSELDRVGLQYLKAMRERYPGNLDAALIAYNFGPSNADKFIKGKKKLPTETKNYIKKVRKELGQPAKQIEREPMSRDKTRQTLRRFTGTPAENRAIQAGLRATTKALNEGKSKAEAQKIGADTAAKLNRDSRRTFNKRFAMLATSAIGGGGLAIAGKGLGMAGKALVKVLRKQKGAGKKAKELAQTRGKRSRAQLDRPKTKPTSQDAGTIRRAKKALGPAPKIKKTTTKKSTDKKLPKNKVKKTTSKGNIVPTAVVGGTALTAGGVGLDKLRKENMAKATGDTKKGTINYAGRRGKKNETGLAGIKTKKVVSPIKQVSVTTKTPAKPKSKPKDEAMSFGEMIKGAVGMRGAKGLEGAKRIVKTPFGEITFDTSDDAFEKEIENKAGGKVKRNVGGKVRGVGQAMKGFGKATYSNKMY